MSIDLFVAIGPHPEQPVPLPGPSPDPAPQHHLPHIPGGPEPVPTEDDELPTQRSV